MRRFGVRFVLGGLVFVACAAPLTAQQAYQAPRTSDGKPDFQGIWQVLNTAEYDIQDHGARPGVPPGRAIVENNDLPYKPGALAQKQKNAKAGTAADFSQKCYYPGVPRLMYTPFPFQIVQTQEYMAMLFEYGHFERLVYTDGFAHHEGIPFYMGDPRGKWDGDTFVIESRGFTSDTWFDRAGNYHSEDMKLTERLTRVGPDHINYEATIDDPKVYTRPWKMKFTLYRRVEPDAQILEYECFAMKVYDEGIWNKYEKKPRPAPPASRAKPGAKPGGGPTPMADR